MNTIKKTTTFIQVCRRGLVKTCTGRLKTLCEMGTELESYRGGEAEWRCEPSLTQHVWFRVGETSVRYVLIGECISRDMSFFGRVYTLFLFPVGLCSTQFQIPFDPKLACVCTSAGVT